MLEVDMVTWDLLKTFPRNKTQFCFCNISTRHQIHQLVVSRSACTLHAAKPTSKQLAHPSETYVKRTVSPKMHKGLQTQFLKRHNRALTKPQSTTEVPGDSLEVSPNRGSQNTRRSRVFQDFGWPGKIQMLATTETQ